MLITLPFVGIAGWNDYLTLLANLANFEGVFRNFALGALASRAGAPEWFSQAALFVGYAVAGVAVALSLRRDRDVSFVVTLGATLLLSPLLWDHYMTNLLVPAASWPAAAYHGDWCCRCCAGCRRSCWCSSPWPA